MGVFLGCFVEMPDRKSLPNIYIHVCTKYFESQQKNMKTHSFQINALILHSIYEILLFLKPQNLKTD